MMQKTIQLALLIAFAGVLNAQVPGFAWVKPIYGATPSAAASAVVLDLETDPAGNSYLAGEFYTKLDLGNGIFLETNGTDAAFFLLKYSPAGSPLWAKKIAQTQPDAGSSFTYSADIAVDDAGNVYWCGNYAADGLDFGGGTSITRFCNNDCQEGFRAKVAPDGALLYAKSLHASSGQQFSVGGIAAAADGVHYLSGTFFGTELYLQGGANIGGIQDDGYYAAAFDASGNAQWIAFLPPGPNDPEPQAVVVSPDGQQVAVIGSYAGPSLNFGNSATTSSNANAKRFVVWYNTQGQPLSAGTIASDQVIEYGSLQMDDQYRVWAACDYKGNLSWNDNAFGTPGTAASSQLLVKLQTNQAPEYTVKVEHNGNGAPLSNVALGNNGQFYTSGFFENAISVPGGPGFSSMGCSDLLFAGGSGQSFQWANRVGQSGCEESNPLNQNALLDVDGSGNLYACGNFSNGANIGGQNMPGNGLWVAKLSTGMVPVQDEQALALSLEIFPNPASERLGIRGERLSYQIFTADGKLVHEALSDGSDYREIELAHWPSGLYYLKAKDEKGQSAVKNFGVSH